MFITTVYIFCVCVYMYTVQGGHEGVCAGLYGAMVGTYPTLYLINKRGCVWR